MAKSGTPSLSTSPTQEASLAEALLAANDPDTAVSVAVLPFANVSADPEQDFFSDGMTDEISGALSKIPDLRVVARTSAYSFKNQVADGLRVARKQVAPDLLVVPVAAPSEE